MEAISEAFNKCFVADFIFSISRTIEHKNTNTGKMFVAKNRFGPDGLIHPIFMDTSNVKIEVFEHIDESIEDLNAKAAREQASRSAKEQAEVLKEKYKEFKNGRNKKDA